MVKNCYCFFIFGSERRKRICLLCLCRMQQVKLQYLPFSFGILLMVKAAVHMHTLNPINAYNTIMKEDPTMLLINIRSLPLPVLKHLPRQRLSLHLVLDIHSWFPSSLLGSTRLAGLGRRLALGTCKSRWARGGFGGFRRGLG